MDGLGRKEKGNGSYSTTYSPMKERRKSTRSAIFSIAGTTRSCRQSLASGHLDMMCASSGTFVMLADVAEREFGVVSGWRGCCGLFRGHRGGGEAREPWRRKRVPTRMLIAAADRYRRVRRESTISA